MAVFYQGNQEIGFEAAEVHFGGLAKEFLAGAEAEDGAVKVVAHQLGEGFGSRQAIILRGDGIGYHGLRGGLCGCQVAQGVDHGCGAMAQPRPDAASGLAVGGGDDSGFGHHK